MVQRMIPLGVPNGSATFVLSVYAYSRPRGNYIAQDDLATSDRKDADSVRVALD
jgi:hypothetical protein